MQPAYLTPHCTGDMHHYSTCHPHCQGLRQDSINHLVATERTILARLRLKHQSIRPVRANAGLLNDTFVPLEDVHASMLWVLATNLLTSLDSLRNFNIWHNNQPPKTSDSISENDTM